MITLKQDRDRTYLFFAKIGRKNVGSVMLQTDGYYTDIWSGSHYTDLTGPYPTLDAAKEALLVDYTAFVLEAA